MFGYYGYGYNNNEWIWVIIIVFILLFIVFGNNRDNCHHGHSQQC